MQRGDPHYMTVPIGIKGIREGLLITLDEGEWGEVFPALLDHLDTKPDFFLGAKAFIRLGPQPLFVADLAKLRSELADRGISLRAVISEVPATISAAQSLGLEIALPASETRDIPIDSALTGTEAVLARQTLRSGNSIQYPGHVVIIGDVNPGAEIVAGGSVVVWGRLRGTVHAGAQGDESAVVCALDLAPMQLRIAGRIAISPTRQGEPRPEMAVLRDGVLHAELWKPLPSAKG
jgi:septum site-determining protein MinC